MNALIARCLKAPLAMQKQSWTGQERLLRTIGLITHKRLLNAGKMNSNLMSAARCLTPPKPPSKSNGSLWVSDTWKVIRNMQTYTKSICGSGSATIATSLHSCFSYDVLKHGMLQLHHRAPVEMCSELLFSPKNKGIFSCTWSNATNHMIIP